MSLAARGLIEFDHNRAVRYKVNHCGSSGRAPLKLGILRLFLASRDLVSHLLRGSGSAQHLRHFSVAFRMALTSVGHPVDPAFDPGDSLIGGRMAGEEPIEGGA